jgi:hypothetical protein
MTLPQAEAQLEDAYRIRSIAYEDSKWRPTLVRIVSVEDPESDELRSIADSISDEIQALSIRLYTTASPLSMSSPPAQIYSPPQPPPSDTFPFSGFLDPNDVDFAFVSGPAPTPADVLAMAVQNFQSGPDPPISELPTLIPNYPLSISPAELDHAPGDPPKVKKSLKEWAARKKQKAVALSLVAAGSSQSAESSAPSSPVSAVPSAVPSSSRSVSSQSCKSLIKMNRVVINFQHFSCYCSELTSRCFSLRST